MILESLVFTYTRPRATQCLTCITEWTDDLASNTWSPAGTTAQVIADNGTVQTIRTYIPAANAPHRYVWLRVIQE